MMIKLIIDTSNATKEELLELDKLLPIKTMEMQFIQHNIQVTYFDKADMEIANANGINLDSRLSKSAVLGCIQSEPINFNLNNNNSTK